MGLISKIEDKLSGNSGHQAEKQAEKQAQNYMSGQQKGSGGGLQQQAEKQYAKHEMSNAMGGSGGNSSGLGGLEQKAQGLSLGSGQAGSGATAGRDASGMTSGTSGAYGGVGGSGISSQTAERYGAPGASGYSSGTNGGYGTSGATSGPTSNYAGTGSTSGVTGGAPTAAGVGAGAGAASAGLSSGGGSRSHDLRHPVGSGGQSGYIPPSGSAVNNPVYPGNGGQRVTSGASQGSGSSKTQASEPYDPYSSAGQRTAADAAPNVGAAGYGQPGQALTHDQPRTSYDEQGIPRTAHGGISNSQPASQNDRNFISGPTSYMSNPEAVPTAGGRTIGDGQESHTGRNAALGAGAAGAGAYGLHEEQKHGHHHGHHGHHHGQSGSTHSGSTGGVLHHDSRHAAQGQPDMIGRSYEQMPSSNQQHHYGRDAALGAGAAGAGAYGAHELGQHHGHHGQGDKIRQQAQTEPGLSGQNFAGQGVGSSQPLGNQGGGYNQGAVDAQRAVGGAPAAGASATQPTQSSTTGAGVPSSTFDPKKMGSAYEAGYRDALAHMEAERQRLGQQ